MVVAEFQHQPGPAARDALDTRTPDHLEVPDTVQLWRLERRPHHAAAQSVVRRPGTVSQEVMTAADAEDTAEHGNVWAIVDVHGPLTVQLEPVRHEPTHLRIEPDVL